MANGSMKPVHVILSLLILPLVLTGCGIWPVAGPSTQQVDAIETGKANVKTPKSTKVMNSATLSELEQVSNGGKKLVFEAPATRSSQLASLQSGDVLVFGPTTRTPHGLLRKIENIQRDPGQWEITTTQAALTDAIEEGTIEMSGSIPPKQGSIQGSTVTAEGVSAQVKNGAVNIDLNKVKLTDGVDVEGEITFQGTWNLDIEIGAPFRLKRFEAKPQITQDATVKVISNIVEENFDPEPVTVYKQSLGTFVTPGYPVVVTPQLSVNISVDGKVSIDLSTKIKHNTTFTAGAVYENGDWRSVSNFTTSFKTLNTTIKGELGAKGQVTPRLKFLLYGVVGPFADVNGFLQLKASDSKELASLAVQQTVKSAGLAWKLYAGLSVDVGVDAKVLGVGLNFEADDIIKTKTKIASSQPEENSPPQASFAADPTSGTVPLEVSFDASASSDEDGSIAKYEWQFGDGSVGSGVKTNHTYDSSGTYTVTLTVTDVDGATAIAETTIEVKESTPSEKKVAIINPDHYRILKLGYHKWEPRKGPVTYYSLPMGTKEKNCNGGWTNIDCWQKAGNQRDFIGATLESTGFNVEYYTSSEVPTLSPSDYDLVIVQDPMTQPLKQFSESADTNLPDLLNKATSRMVNRVKDYFNNGGKLLLVGDAVKLLENSSGPSDPRLGFGKDVTAQNSQNTLSNPDHNLSEQLPEQWLFVRGDPFCGTNRRGSGTYTVESSAILGQGTTLANLSFFNGNDLDPTMVWSDTVYSPADGTSLLDVRVQGQGDYVINDGSCNPPERTVSVNGVLSNFMGYTTYNNQRVYYIGSDSFFEFHMQDYSGHPHAGQSKKLDFHVTSAGRDAIIDIVNNAISQ